MALIVEDGTGVENSNTYIDEIMLKQYADNRGLDLPADEELPALIINAMDYIEYNEKSYKGTQLFHLQFPRSEWGETIPLNLIQAQCQLCIDAYENDELTPSSDGAAVVKEKVSVIEVEYANPSPQTAERGPVWTKAERFLKPLYSSGIGGRLLQTKRA